jgi:hypothetical protein
MGQQTPVVAPQTQAVVAQQAPPTGVGYRGVPIA